MAWAKEIKRKIASIKNTWKITKAMELISTVKMKKAQDAVVVKKDYALELLKIFVKIEDSLWDSPYFSAKSWNKTLAVLITSNKWLCWWYNIWVMRKVNSYIKETWEDVDFVTVWKKWAAFITRTWNNLIADFSSEFTDNITPYFSKKISSFIREEFVNTSEYSKVVVFYTHYLNTIKQTALTSEFLPISSDYIKVYLSEITWKTPAQLAKEIKKEENKNIDYKIEPSKEVLSEYMIPVVLDMMFYDLLLEAKASEHSARMVAMKNAKDNAAQIAANLTLRFNKKRQEAITNEVTEITWWVESLKDS